MLKIPRKLYKALLGDPVVKYEARHDMLAYVANKLGYQVYNRYLRWAHDAEYLNAWQGFRYASPGIKDRRFHLYYLAKSVANLPGDTVECGVYQGASSYLILQAMKNGAVKDHHVFDSFEGLSEPAFRDMQSADHVSKWKSNDLSIPEGVVRDALSDFGNVNYYKGWIPSRFDEVRDRAFSFVHIDVDLYQPTMGSIAFFTLAWSPAGSFFVMIMALKAVLAHSIV